MTCRSSRPIVLTPRLAELFWTKVRRSAEGCWLWTAGAYSRTQPGFDYGAFWLRPDPAEQGHMERAHRVAWVIENGAIPVGMCVLHRCDTPRCVRPDHLFLGTQEENIADRHAKRRTAVGSDSRSIHTGRPRNWARGERSVFARLTVERVREIRRRVAAGEQFKAIARDLGCHPASVSRIVHGTTWRGVA